VFVETTTITKRRVAIVRANRASVHQVEIMLLEARTSAAERGEAWKAFAATCANLARS
jgi:hypothetical protein